MKAWQVHAFCEPEQMTLDEIPVPEPGPRQVRIRNHAAALNFFDILQIQGKYQVRPPFPFTPGAEVAGVVDQVGAEVKHVFPGDPVSAMTHNGAFAEYSIAEGSRTFHIIAGLDDSEAAAMPVVYHTSYFALHRRAALGHKEWLLVHAGASGVGMSAIQIGKAYGAHVIATAGSPAKLDFCRRQGADHALSYTDPSWVEQVKQITGGRGVDVVYDPVGGEYSEPALRSIAWKGRFLVVGFAAGDIPRIPLNLALLKGCSIVGVFWGAFTEREPQRSAQNLSELLALLSQGKLKPHISATYPLERAPDALNDMLNRKVQGKVVIVP